MALPGLPWTVEFMSAYTAARDGQPAPVAPVMGAQARSAPGTVAASIASYFQHSSWTDLAASSRMNRRTYLERFRAKFGGGRIANLEARHVAALLASLSPHLQKAWLTAIRGLMAFAVEAKWIAVDPTASLKRAKVSKSGGYRTWTESDVAAFEQRWPLGTPERLAFELALYTGARRGDLLRLEIMAVTEHSSLDEIERYGREFSRPQLGAGAIALLG